MNSPHHPLPYPDTDGMIKMPSLAARVASVRSLELEAISDHIYFTLIFEKSAPVLSELFEKLARSEMEHFLLLGKMTVALGGDPAIKPRTRGHGQIERGTKWQGAPYQALKLALDREKCILESYEGLLDTFSHDQVARALLERIMLDKEHYAKMLSRAVAGS